MSTYKDKSLMIGREGRVPFWIRKTYHAIISKLSKKQNKPMFFYVDEALGEWLLKNNLKK